MQYSHETTTGSIKEADYELLVSVHAIKIADTSSIAAYTQQEGFTMEWHESLRHLLSSGVGEDGDAEDSKPASSPPRSVTQLLIVDRAKPHRSLLYDGQSTVAETQISRNSSMNEDDLSVLFENVDIYDGVEDSLHHSFPFAPATRKRQRSRSKSGNVKDSDVSTANGTDEMGDLLADWGSNSDSMLDYTSLDDMLREEGSQTASTLLNVFQPSRRRSMETIDADGDGLIEVDNNDAVGDF